MGCFSKRKSAPTNRALYNNDCKLQQSLSYNTTF
nr:MAG TPA: hypothetical protein [Caudoviricetes sp.]